MNLIKNLTSLRRLRARHARGNLGIAAVEFALTLPIWITMLLGAADGTYYMLVNEKADRIAYSISDIVTQYSVISMANLDDIIQAAGQLMHPYPFSSKGYVIVSSVYKPAGQVATIRWQYTGGGTLTQTSRIGTTGGTPNLPNGMTLNDNDNIIVSEVYYHFDPMFVSSNLFSSSMIYRIAFYKPRLSPLVTPPT